MTYPGQGGQWPQQGQPGGWQPQGYPQQQYPQFAQQYPPTMGPQPGFDQQPPRPKGRRGLVIGLVVALVALVGGGTTWLALSQSDSAASGSATPAEAAQKLAGSLGNGDVVGLLGVLAPAEAALFTEPIQDATGELKRLGILEQGADPTALTGLRMQAENLVFDESQEQQVNDHVTITKLTGGTLTVTADLSRIPLARDFVDAALSTREQRRLERGAQSRTIDVGEVVREQGRPIRVATVNVDGEWYPSLLYTIADYALLATGEQWPRQSIPANGAASSAEAVKQLLQAALDADLRRVIELLPPGEMGVLHDVGPVLLEAVGSRARPAGVQVTRLETEPSEQGGGTRATVTALELTKDQGRGTFSLVKNGDCYRMTMDGRSEELCASQVPALLESEADSDIPPAARQALEHLSTGVLKQGLGVVTTEVDGRHYVSPVRTFTELGMTVLRSLRPEDIRALLRAAG